MKPDPSEREDTSPTRPYPAGDESTPCPARWIKGGKGNTWCCSYPQTDIKREAQKPRSAYSLWYFSAKATAKGLTLVP